MVDREGRAVASHHIEPHRPRAVVLAGAEHGDDVAGAVGGREGGEEGREEEEEELYIDGDGSSSLLTGFDLICVI